MKSVFVKRIAAASLFGVLFLAPEVSEKNFVFTVQARACLKNHSCNLHAPLCGRFCPLSVDVARYAFLNRTKSPTNCDAHLAESLFQTCSSEEDFLKSAISKIKQGEGTLLGTDFSLDFNQDGTEETFAISVIADPESYVADQYILQIGDCTYSDSGENTQESVYGISLDENEILPVIYETGPSDDPFSTIFQYDGNSLSVIGQIPTWPENMKIEDGILHTKIRCNVMGTMAIETSWKLDETGKLKMLEQDAYGYGKDFTYPGEEDDFFASLKKTITVYSEMNTDSETLKMEPQHVNFPYTNGKDWIYIQGENGQGGWLFINASDYERKTELFDGLVFVD